MTEVVEARSDGPPKSPRRDHHSKSSRTHTRENSRQSSSNKSADRFVDDRYGGLDKHTTYSNASSTSHSHSQLHKKGHRSHSSKHLHSAGSTREKPSHKKTSSRRYLTASSNSSTSTIRPSKVPVLTATGPIDHEQNEKHDKHSARSDRSRSSRDSRDSRGSPSPPTSPSSSARTSATSSELESDSDSSSEETSTSDMSDLHLPRTGSFEALTSQAQQARKSQHRHHHSTSTHPVRSVSARNIATAPLIPVTVSKEAVSLSSSTSSVLSPHALEFIRQEGEILDEFKEKEGSSVVDDANELLKNFMAQFKSVSKGLSKPNVLLTGITGSGKSSLINALFGKSVAATGTGVPITQHFTKYESDDMRVTIYDSKGLEHGQYENFIDTTKTFFEEHKIGQHGESDDAIHVIWYIVNSAHSRFEPFEEQICRQLFNRAPLMFLLNKADISTPQDRQSFRDMIEKMKLPNCVGVFDTVAKSNGQLQQFVACPRCDSDDIVIRKKIHNMSCMDCNYTTSLQLPDGLASMIERTCQVLPDVVRDAFVSAQNVSFSLKETSSRNIINEFWNDFSHVRTPAKLLRIIANMMARLSIVWEFKKHGHDYGETIARDMVSTLNWKDKINLLFHKRTKMQQLHSTALGIIWNRCLRNLSTSLFNAWSAASSSGANVEGEKLCWAMFDHIFADMNPEELEAIESELQSSGIATVLDREFADFKKQNQLTSASTNQLSRSFPSTHSNPESPRYSRRSMDQDSSDLDATLPRLQNDHKRREKSHGHAGAHGHKKKRKHSSDEHAHPAH